MLTILLTFSSLVSLVSGWRIFFLPDEPVEVDNFCQAQLKSVCGIDSIPNAYDSILLSRKCLSANRDIVSQDCISFIDSLVPIVIEECFTEIHDYCDLTWIEPENTVTCLKNLVSLSDRCAAALYGPSVSYDKNADDEVQSEEMIDQPHHVTLVTSSSFSEFVSVFLPSPATVTSFIKAVSPCSPLSPFESSETAQQPRSDVDDSILPVPNTRNYASSTVVVPKNTFTEESSYYYNPEFELKYLENAAASTVMDDQVEFENYNDDQYSYEDDDYYYYNRHYNDDDNSGFRSDDLDDEAAVVVAINQKYERNAMKNAENLAVQHKQQQLRGYSVAFDDVVEFLATDDREGKQN